MAKILIAAGIVLVIAGVLIHFKMPLGRLPGDIVFEKENLRLYIPITTSILASLALSLILWIVGKLK